MFFAQGILLTTHLLNLSKLTRTFKRYRAMHSSLASYSPWIYPITSWESLYISNLVVDRVRAKSNPTSIAFYSALLLEIGNPSRTTCSNYSSVGDCKRRPIPDPETRDALLTWRIHHPFLRDLASWDDFWGISVIKSVMTCPFMASLGWYLIMYSLNYMAHLSILPDRSGLCKILLSGWLVSTITWWAWK